MKRTGKRSILFDEGVYITSSASCAGIKEGEGPLGNSFDEIIKDDLAGTETWEKAESEFLKRVIRTCLKKAGKDERDAGAVLAGDLNAQIIASGFAARDLGTPFIGLYGACSTMTEGLMMGAILVSSGAIENAVCAASSHFCTAERQFRTPLELGTQRPPSAQWTATAAGACLIEKKKSNIRIASATIGRVIDLKIKDSSHMGAAMAPAVADTFSGHFSDTGTAVSDYDLIVTGDLGIYGSDILTALLEEEMNISLKNKIYDCGGHLYKEDQDAHAGGSGCGCIAGVLSGHILNRISQGSLKRVLVLGSGAMMSVTSSLQGESIPSVSYAVSLERC